MPFSVVYTDQLSARNGVKSVCYGRPGVGKTVLCASAPLPFIISAEKGLLSLRKYRIPAAQITTMADLNEATQWVLRSAEARNYDTICLDSMSDCAEVLLAHEKAHNTDKKNGFKPYNELGEQFMNAMRQFRALDQKHVYFIAKEEYDKDENGMMMYQPSMPGKTLTREIPYLVDEIFRLTTWTDQASGQLMRGLQTNSTNNVVAKDRSGALAPWEPADLGAIFAKIMA